MEKQKRYWLRGGIITTVVLSILVFIFLKLGFTDVFTFFAPALFSGMLGLGMRTTPASTSEVYQTLTIAFIITVVSYFIIGVILGFVYGKIRPRKKLFVSFICFIIFGLFLITYLNIPFNYGNFSISDCNNPIMLMKKGFYKDICYSAIAKEKQDLSLCEKLPNNSGNYGRDACVSAIAGDKKDYTLCEQMSAYASKGIDYDRCIEAIANRKGECDVIPRQIGRDYCYLYQWETMKVTVRDNRCDIYKETARINSCEDYKNGQLTPVDACNKIVDKELKNQCLNYSGNGVRVEYSY